ncbi:DnaJ domain-containing protein, partial [Choanephora cucurbitarum]
RRNFYDVLQLRENADRKSIKANYYKLSKKYHPDLNPNNKEAHKLFLEINEAYAVLGNEASKRRYDSDRTESSSNASRWSRTTGGGSNTQAWQHFRNRRARSTGSSSAKEQAEKMGRQATAGSGFNYNEHYSRHYAAEEHKRRERMANAAKRR